MRPEAFELARCSHRESRSLLATGAPAYLCVNPVEYHGPHLSLHNDTLIARALCQELHGALRAAHPGWPLLLAPDLALGAQTVPGPGSQDLPYPQLVRAVQDASRALYELGARRVVLMSFHGAPLHNLAVDSGLRLLRARGVQVLAPLPLLVAEITSGDTSRLSPVLALIPDAGQRGMLDQALARDLHAGFLETSLSLHYVPETVDQGYDQLPPAPAVPPLRSLEALSRGCAGLGLGQLARDVSYIAHGVPWLRQRPHPGYTGCPHLARPEVGAMLARMIVERYAALAGEVFSGRGQSPRPAMAWMAPATLGGRLLGQVGGDR